MKQLFQIIFSASKKQICTKKPVGVRSFASYVIDLTKVHLPDLTADDNGIWRVSMPRRTYKVTLVDDTVIDATEVRNPADDEENVFTVTRQYGTHAGTPEFRRIITTIASRQMGRARYAVLQYFFKGGKRIPVILSHHGNSHSETPHIQTAKSVRSAIQKRSATPSKKSPSEVYTELFLDSGGISDSQSLSQQPRNRKQLYNARHMTKSDADKDELYALLSQLEAHSKKPDSFLREVLFSPLPAAILFYDSQLQSLQSFCCQNSKFGHTILGVDATFNLGDFYVTITTFQHPQLQRRTTRKAPVFIGPVFIHMQRRFEDYLYFFMSVLKYCPGLATLAAYGTDGERALVKALESCFPNALGLRCFIHKKKNIEHHLHEKMHVSAGDRKKILDDLFGRSEGDTYVSGLVDAESEAEFDEDQEELLTRWESLAPGFHAWFTKEQSHDFKKCMLSSVRRKVGIEAPLETFTNNPNESVNSTVKKWQNFERKSWSEFIEKFAKLVQAQLVEAQKAIYGSGEFELHEDFKHLQIEPGKWLRMSSTARMGALSKAGFVSIEDSEACSLKDMSTSILDVGIVSIPTSTLQAIEDKAKQLLSENSAIVPAPGSPGAFMVKSVGGERPHFVTVKTGGVVNCDSSCPQWRGSRLCSHIVAVAEREDCLSQLLVNYTRSKRETNLTRMIVTPKQKSSAGSKSGQPYRSRKGKEKKVVRTVESQPWRQSPSQRPTVPTQTY